MCSEEHSAFIFRTKKSSVLLLFDPENEGLPEISVTMYKLTCHNIPDNFNLQQQCYEDLKSCRIADT
jgi:hypothetical protein